VGLDARCFFPTWAQRGLAKARLKLALPESLVIEDLAEVFRSLSKLAEVPDRRLEKLFSNVCEQLAG